MGRKFVVALTGGIGSGKSAVADLFASHGASVVDTDVIAHRLTGPAGAAMPAIVAEFGPAFARPDGSLDRAAMRAHAFADSAARERLNAILHPRIFAESVAELEAAQGCYVVLVVPLLFETGRYAALADTTLAVDCPEDVQLARVMARSGLAREQVAAIMAAQLGRAERRARADDVIDNSGDLATLALQVAAKHRYYLSRIPVAANPAAIPSIEPPRRSCD